jgi:hypothetical protein
LALPALTRISGPIATADSRSRSRARYGVRFSANLTDSSDVPELFLKTFLGITGIEPFLLVDTVIGLLKSIHWGLGTRYFPMIEWRDGASTDSADSFLPAELYTIDPIEGQGVDEVQPAAVDDAGRIIGKGRPANSAATKFLPVAAFTEAETVRPHFMSPAMIRQHHRSQADQASSGSVIYPQSGISKRSVRPKSSCATPRARPSVDPRASRTTTLRSTRRRIAASLRRPLARTAFGSWAKRLTGPSGACSRPLRVRRRLHRRPCSRDPGNSPPPVSLQ